MRVLAVTAVAALLVSAAVGSITSQGGNIGGGITGTALGGTLGGNQGVYQTGSSLGGGFQTGGLDSFGSALGGDIAGGYQVGTAQVSQRDQHSNRDQTQWLKDRKHLDQQDASQSRADDQQRQGDLRESAFSKNDQQEQGTASHQSKTYDTNRDAQRRNTQRQNDLNDKHGIRLDSQGRYYRNDAARNSGDKALGQKKDAFARRNSGFENIDYGFAKDFNVAFNERGGIKEAVGQDNNNLDVYEEKQKDNRFSKGLLDAFRRSRDNNAFQRQSDWLSNAAQKQDNNQRYGAADRQQNAAEKQDLDFNSLLDRKNDKFWHRDNAKDQAVRQATDLAEKRADNQKNALATASGLKGVDDSKYYKGGTYGQGTGATGTAGNVALGTAGAGGLSGTGTQPYYGSSTGPVAGTGLATGGAVVGTGVAGAPVRGRAEGRGGDYVNTYKEDARQQDNSQQRSGNQAQSDATALNDYNRERGVDDSVEVTGQQEGKWASQQAGLRDANSQGFNNNDANALKSNQLADNSIDASKSASTLEAANKNLQAQELDRVNFKKNQVDNNQRIRKKKVFYHDKNEDGFNNEALNYNRDRGNQDWGEEQAAQKEARTRFDNVADDNKVNNQQRGFNVLDERRISTGDATSKEQDNAGGWASLKDNARQEAVSNKNAFDNGKQNSEFDSFARQQQNRNQKLWDDARRDLRQLDGGKDSNRQIDAAFVFAPDFQRNNLGFGASSTPFGQSRIGTTGGSRFGIGGRGPSVSTGFGGDSFMDDFGKTSFGQTGLRGGAYSNQGQGTGTFGGTVVGGQGQYYQ